MKYFLKNLVKQEKQQEKKKREVKRHSSGQPTIPAPLVPWSKRSKEPPKNCGGWAWVGEGVVAKVYLHVSLIVIASARVASCISQICVIIKDLKSELIEWFSPQIGATVETFKQRTWHQEVYHLYIHTVLKLLKKKFNQISTVICPDILWGPYLIFSF